jgi:hypothetical protein
MVATEENKDSVILVLAASHFEIWYHRQFLYVQAPRITKYIYTGFYE